MTASHASQITPISFYLLSYPGTETVPDSEEEDDTKMSLKDWLFSRATKAVGLKKKPTEVEKYKSPSLSKCALFLNILKYEKLSFFFFLIESNI